jgi:hypothetical protein
MFTKITFAALVVTTIASAAPVLQSTEETTTKVENSAAQVWCSGPRQFIDFRCRR